MWGWEWRVWMPEIGASGLGMRLGWGFLKGGGGHTHLAHRLPPPRGLGRRLLLFVAWSLDRPLRNSKKAVWVASSLASWRPEGSLCSQELALSGDSSEWGSLTSIIVSLYGAITEPLPGCCSWLMPFKAHSPFLLNLIFSSQCSPCYQPATLPYWI